jgi:hypothetical protein
MWYYILTSKKKQAMFEMEICNDNYGRTKNDNIIGCNEKNIRPILAINMIIIVNTQQKKKRKRKS